MSEENNISNAVKTLSAKIEKEYTEYIGEVKSSASEYAFTTGKQDIDYAISHAYEIAIKNEISLTIYYNAEKHLTEEQISVLLGCENTLDEIYKEWIETDTADLADLISCAAKVADDISASAPTPFYFNSDGRK